MTVKRHSADEIANVYAQKMQEIESHLRFLQLQLKDHAARASKAPNWGRIGDLSHVEQKLADLTSFLAS